MRHESVPPEGVLTCPDCGREAPPDQLLCECGYPLEFDQRRQRVVQAPPSVTRAPGEEDDDTAEIPPLVGPVPFVPADPAPPRGGAASRLLTCPSCAEDNELDRTWCRRCGHKLRDEPHPVPPAPRPPRRRSALPLVAGGIVAAVLLTVLGGAGVWAWLEGRAEPGAAAPASVPASAAATATATAEDAPAVVERLPVEGVEVEASSVQTPGDRYAPELTLDNRVDTAWNHNGSRDDPDGVPPEGVRLTYTFDAPVNVAGLLVVNGYVKTNESGRDLFAANHRVKQVAVSGESGSQTVTLEDTRDEQQVDVEIGPTSQVTLEVLSTYPGNRYGDVALSEVGFLVRP